MRQFGLKSANALVCTNNQGCRFGLSMLPFPTARWWQEVASSQTLQADCARHTSCPGGSPSSLPFVIRSYLSSFVSHGDGCVWRAWTEATSEGSFLKLRAYDGLKVEIMRKLIRLEMSARVYMCVNLGEDLLFFWAHTHQLFKPGSSLAIKEGTIFPARSSLWDSCIPMWLEMMPLSL